MNVYAKQKQTHIIENKFLITNDKRKGWGTLQEYGIKRYKLLCIK